MYFFYNLHLNYDLSYPPCSNHTLKKKDYSFLK